jgi:uncharacterized membrane protein
MYGEEPAMSCVLMFFAAGVCITEIKCKRQLSMQSNFTATKSCRRQKNIYYNKMIVRYMQKKKMKQKQTYYIYFIKKPIIVSAQTVL